MSELAKFLELSNERKESTNAFNRQNTVVRNVFKENIQTKKWVLGTTVRFKGHEFSYEAADSTVIPPEDFYELLKNGDITEEQFLKCISVRKSDVSTFLGSDITLNLEQPTEGKTYSVRAKELPLEESDDQYVSIPAPTNIIKRRKRLGRGKQETVAIRRPKIRRRIKD